jgi:4-hydroxybenzoyl-CoA thioesterase
MSEFCLPIRVYIEDTDAGGIVYYVNYLKYMERSRTEFLRSLGYDKVAVLEEGVFGESLLLVVHSVQVNYRKPARLDDQLIATTKLEKLARTYMQYQQQVRRGQDILSEGSVCVACVNAQTMKPTALPTEMYAQLKKYV